MKELNFNSQKKKQTKQISYLHKFLDCNFMFPILTKRLFDFHHGKEFLLLMETDWYRIVILFVFHFHSSSYKRSIVPIHSSHHLQTNSQLQIYSCHQRHRLIPDVWIYIQPVHGIDKQSTLLQCSNFPITARAHPESNHVQQQNPRGCPV